MNAHALKLLLFEAHYDFITVLNLIGWSLLMQHMLTWQNLATLVGKSTPDASDYEGTALPQITTQMLDTQLDPGLNSAG